MHKNLKIFDNKLIVFSSWIHIEAALIKGIVGGF
jgi:hypothetical protein